MCSSTPAPASNVATPPPAAAPQPLALSEPSGGGANLSQLRIGSKANLKMRAPTSGLTIPTPQTPSEGAAA